MINNSKLIGKITEIWDRNKLLSISLFTIKTNHGLWLRIYLIYFNLIRQARCISFYIRKILLLMQCWNHSWANKKNLRYKNWVISPSLITECGVARDIKEQFEDIVSLIVRGVLRYLNK